MTNKTYIVSDFSENVQFITEKLNIPESNVISHIKSENEKGFHDWLQGVFSKNEIEKLIIPISISDDSVINTQGLLIGLHIRLNYQLSIEKRCIPIIFLSDFSMENIIKADNFDKDNNPQNLLFTKGSYFSTFDIEDIEGTIEKSIACSEEEYESNVLSQLNIKRKATFGGHDISNAWGSYKLGLIIGMGDTIFDQEYASKYLKQLYAKHLICKNEVYDNKKLIDTNPLKCSDKKILFIDDKADEGWGLLMREIFKGAKNDFVFVDPSKYKANDEHRTFNDFDGFYEECQSHIGNDWDLIIIDLRLDPENEDIDNSKIAPKELSGYKLIDEFLTKNEGYQIIVSTASNKIWNINAALDRGANSYYIKESPDFNHSIRDSQLQFTEFKEEVDKCFERSYLRDIYKEIEDLIEIINKLGYDSDFLETIKTQLKLSYYLLKDAVKEEQFAYAYVSLYMIIEMINNQLIIKTSDDEWRIASTNEPLLDWTFDIPAQNYTNSNTPIIGNKPPEWRKMAGLYFQKWGGKDVNIIQQLYYLIDKRNGFVHNDKEKLDKTRKDRNGKNIKDKDGDLVYLNHDIYDSEGFIKLFKYIKVIIKLL